MISEDQLRKRAKQDAQKADGQKRYAAILGLSESVLSMFISGARKPSKNILSALGFEPVTMYRKKTAHQEAEGKENTSTTKKETRS